MSASFFDITRAVAAYRGIDHALLATPCRRREIAWPRQEVVYLAKVIRPELSYPIMGRILRRDHTTLLHGYRRVEARIAESAAYAADILAMRQWLRSPRMHQERRELLACQSIARFVASAYGPLIARQKRMAGWGERMAPIFMLDGARW